MKSKALLPVIFTVPFVFCVSGVLAGDAARARAEGARSRLEATEAGRVVLRSFGFHGTLRSWYSGGALRFRYDYHPIDETKTRRDTTQTVNLLNSTVYHSVHQPVEGLMAFDGKRAWSTFPPEQIATRFWCLTPYYFVAMPFVFADPGANLEIVDDDPEAAGLPASTVIRVTFGEDVGDAPDDYYIAYFAKDDGRLLAIRYIVSYAPFFSESDSKHSPEKLLVFERFESSGPVRLARTHSTYAFSDGRRGEKVTTSTVSDVAYGVSFEASRLVPPAGAMIDRSLDSD
ncbi:MAG: hypothetical protein AAFP04_06755 [Myxococcota bacterium]